MFAVIRYNDDVWPEMVWYVEVKLHGTDGIIPSPLTILTHCNAPNLSLLDV